MHNDTYTYVNIFKKIRQLNSDEIITDDDWPNILKNDVFIFNLLKRGDFKHLSLLPSHILEQPVVSSILMRYSVPPINFIPLSTLSNTAFICEALSYDYRHISYIPTSYLTFDILTWYCQQFGNEEDVISFIPETLLTKDLVKIIVKKNNINFCKLPSIYRNDIDVYNCIKKSSKHHVFSFAGKNIKNNPFLVIEALEKSPELYPSIDNSLKTPDFFLRQLKHIPNLLEFATDNIRNNEHCVWESIKVMPASLLFASERLLNTPSFALQVSKGMSKTDFERSFAFWGSQIRQHKETIMDLIVLICQSSFVHLISESLRADKDVMLSAIHIDPYWFKLASRPLSLDPQFLKQSYDILIEKEQYASTKNKSIDKLFSSIDPACFNDPQYLLSLYENFNTIFISVIYPIIIHHDSQLIKELKHTYDSGEEHLVSFMDKIKLRYSLEKSLQQHKNHELIKI